MPVRLVDDENEWSVELPLDDDLREALLIQAQRQPLGSSGAASFPARLEKGFLELLVDAVDHDIKPPSRAQVTYALAISKRLGVSVPAEALRFRGTMRSFIARYDEVFRTSHHQEVAR